MEQFLLSLEKEIALRASEFSRRETFETIFFGGGTPSLLAPSIIEKILNQLHTLYRIEPNAEITLETNPGTVDLEKLRAFRSAGINRISMGIQSFHQDELNFLTRIHTEEEAEECVRNCYRAGFENVNFDLLFALPHQTIARWKETLRRGIALQPKHISAYSLIVEENTPLYSMVKSKQVSPLPEHLDADMYETTIETLTSHGYAQYEVSNFAHNGFESRHNKNYWNHANYLSFGPSAHSFWKTNATHGKRWWNARSVNQYCADLAVEKFPVSGEEVVDAQKMFNEEIFLGLRSGGLDLKLLKNVYGADIFSTHAMLLKKFEQEQFLSFDAASLRLTSKGYMMCDAIAEKLLR